MTNPKRLTNTVGQILGLVIAAALAALALSVLTVLILLVWRIVL